MDKIINGMYCWFQICPRKEKEASLLASQGREDQQLGGF
jgi:hypothetical protein